MATIKQQVGTKSNLTCADLPTLASATYCVSSPYSPSTNNPLDVVVEVEAVTTNAPAGNKQLVIFVKESLDGTNYRSGPESGTTTTDEANLRLLGILPMNSSSVTQRGTFSIVNSLGYVPPYFKVVCKNDLGVALTGGNLYTAEIFAVSQ